MHKLVRNRRLCQKPAVNGASCPNADGARYEPVEQVVVHFPPSLRLKCGDSPPTTTTHRIKNMKRILTILTIAALGVAFTAPVQAGKGKKNK